MGHEVGVAVVEDEVVDVRDLADGRHGVAVLPARGSLTGIRQL